MKYFWGILFLLCFINGFSQIVSFNESTTLLNKPNGKPAFQINAGVEYWYHYPSYEDVWAEITVPCFVLKTSVTDSSVAKGSILLDYNGKNIGIVLNNTKCNIKPSIFTYSQTVPDSLFYIWLKGFVEKDKINTNVNINEIMKNNIGLCDSSISISRVFTFYNSVGEPQTIQENNRIYFAKIGKDLSSRENVIIKEKITTTTLFGACCDYRTTKIEIIKDYNTEHPQSFIILNDGYKCDISYDKIIFYEYNWSAGPEERYLYSVSTFKQLMNFHGDLYTISTPNSNIEGFIGYKPVPKEWESTYTGYLYFATPEKVLINKKIICRKKELIDKLTIFDAKIRFVPLDNRDVVCNYDSTRFILNSKSGCENETCLTNFRIIMSLGYDMYNIPITLEFRDGDVFLVKNYQDAFELR
ncbi:MAG: hypothetical protein CVU11_08595 [Bacteroidetes bacterium HGW-Bacteroidetes-6]|jgi:hypothetical protein|nr:MAG: hypothetical protein CVU11_08595 [Bacteroidetes bacterium HGW-Bacteroidetes-6]